MKIIAKSAPVRENILAKLRTCKNIEIQLLDHITCVDQIYDYYKECVSVEGADYICVHTPLIRQYCSDLECVDDDIVYYDILYSYCLALRLAVKQNHTVKLIVHTDISMYKLNLLANRRIRLCLTILRLCKEILYDNHIELVIENVTPVHFDKETGEFTEFRNGVYFEAPEFVRWLRYEFGETDYYDHIGTVLDICHAITTIRVEQLLSTYDKDIVQVKTLEDFFIANKGFCKLIHLNDVINLGLRKGEHGSVCTDETLKLFGELYKKYNYDADITLEVDEPDYIECPNFTALYPRVVNLMEGLGYTVE